MAVLLLVITLAGTLLQLAAPQRRTGDEPAARASFLLHAALVFGAAITLTPLAWMVAASFMPTGEANTSRRRFWPSRPTLEHYVALFTRLDLARHFLNSALITIGRHAPLGARQRAWPATPSPSSASAGGTGSSASSCWRSSCRRRSACCRSSSSCASSGFVNTYVGVLVPYLASVFGIFLVRQYALGIPDDLLDAARVDGAGEFAHLPDRSSCPSSSRSSSRSPRSPSSPRGTTSCGR